MEDFTLQNTANRPGYGSGTRTSMPTRACQAAGSYRFRRAHSLSMANITMQAIELTHIS